MNENLKLKLVAKQVINDYKRYLDHSEVYMVHLDNYHMNYENLSIRSKVKFIMGVFEKIFVEFGNKKNIGILWELKEVIFIDHSLSTFEMISEYLHKWTPPLIIIANQNQKRMLLKKTIKKQRINHELVFYFKQNKRKNYYEQQLLTFYEINENK